MEKGKVKEMQNKILAYNCLMFAKNNKGFFSYVSYGNLQHLIVYNVAEKI